ncbi:hypothetical protein Sango_2689000 [Sesamum angolense]|uniref:Uncharacterized protein n=1 Tax=Sesamum angolense TaxID=2727404 RepID=A0AAE1W2J7_9LAMI|nr:hypothetical protein Sango_2689000 [Sesamum angolense]
MRNQKLLKTGVPKSKVASANQKLIRKAKIIRNCNRSSIPSTNNESKVGSNGVNLERRALVSSNSSSRPGSDIGVRVSSSNGDMPPSNSHNSAVYVSHVGCSIPQNLGHNNGSTSSFGSNVGSTASGSNKAPVDSNVGMMTLGGMPSSYPQNFLSSSLTPASSNSLGEALSATNTQSLPHLDVHMDLLGDTSGSNTQNFVSRNDSAAPPSSEMGMIAICYRLDSECSSLRSNESHLSAAIDDIILCRYETPSIAVDALIFVETFEWICLTDYGWIKETSREYLCEADQTEIFRGLNMVIDEFSLTHPCLSDIRIMFFSSSLRT